MQGLSVPVIMGLVYGLISIIKPLIKDKKYLAFMPLLSGGVGIVLGIISFYAIPSIVLSTNVFHAMLVGLCSGLSATGANQLVKQIEDYVAEVNQKSGESNSAAEKLKTEESQNQASQTEESKTDNSARETAVEDK